MSKLSVMWIAVAACIVLGLSAGTASADQNLIEICHKGKNISVDVHAVPAHLEHGDHVGSCGGDSTCACGLEFDPVTCANGVTYANECLARCAGAPEPCGRLGVCSNIFNPVLCSSTGVIYANRCLALNAGCPPGDITVLCACPLIYAPVQCGDGNVYINSCVASCRGASGCTPLN